MSTESRSLELTEWTDRHYRQAVEHTAARLRDVADQIERDGLAVNGGLSPSGAPPYSWAAHRVIHALTWGLANSNVDNIVTQAGSADAAWLEARRED